jgi:hypothetical protein
MATVILIASKLLSPYGAGNLYYGAFYNPQAAYGACQVDALQGLHYPINGDCPNWEAWKARHMREQTSPHGRVYPNSRSRQHLNQ